MRPRATAGVLRIMVFLLALVGVFGVAPIALDEFRGIQSCPALGFIPACYVALLGYGLVALSALLAKPLSLIAAVAGLLPVLALAVTGTGFELAGAESCPRSSGGQPLCFYSLALAIGLAVAYFMYYRLSGQADSVTLTYSDGNHRRKNR